MAIYHCSISITGRGKGKSAVAAAAYRAGEKITNERDGLIHDFTYKSGVVHKEIILPENAPAEYSNRTVLWNAVERAEKAENSQLAREIEVALPIEFSYMQNVNLVREYVRKNFVDNGMCADICIHDNKKGNPHAHILLTMRPFNDDGAWGVKQRKVYHLDDDGNKIYDSAKRQYKCGKMQTTDWNERHKAEEWRAAWADTVNRYLEAINHTERIDHRSFVRQGIDLVPTVHMGAAAHSMEKRGIRTERGDRNREIELLNSRLRQIKARIRKLEDEKWEVISQKDTAPTMYDIFSAIINNPDKHTLTNIQNASQALIFIQKYNIDTFADMAAAVQSLYAKYSETHAETVKMSRRYQTLTEHIRHGENYAKYSKIYFRHNELKGEKQDRFYDKHKDEISAFVEAHKYMERHLNGRKQIPFADWKSEFAGVTTQRNVLLAESENLSAELKNAEAIKRHAEKLMGADWEQPKRARGNER